MHLEVLYSLSYPLGIPVDNSKCSLLCNRMLLWAFLDIWWAEVVLHMECFSPVLGTCYSRGDAGICTN